MKILRQFTNIIPIMLLVLTLQSCNDDDDAMSPPEQMTIAETAQATGDLSILVSALQAADIDLVSLLDGSEPYTVFAPTNAAFNAFLSENGFADLNAVPTDVLTQILLNHVISGEIRASGIIGLGEGYLTTNADGPENTKLSMYFTTDSGVQLNGVSTVTTPDVIASNGVVHIVDRVIGLPSITDFALANDNLSSLVAALQLADTDSSDPDYVNTLASSGTFTVFAPTNTAFSDLLLELDDTGNTALADLDPALVGSVLSYHVLAGANVTSSELTTSTVTTLGGDIDIDATSLTITDPNDRTSNIIVELVDIQATNGVVHAIDKVILPLM